MNLIHGMDNATNIRAVHVIAGLGTQYGGPSLYVPSLCAALASVGCDATILTISGADSVAGPGINAFAPDFANVPIFGALRSSSGMRAALGQATRNADVVHAHGLWLMPNVYAGRAASRARKPLIVTPHGSLAPAALQRSKIRKKVFWRWLQRPAYLDAFAWHATSAAESADIAAFGVTAPVATIPVGIEIPNEVARHDPVKSRRKLLFLSRLHPHKNLDLLIDVWRRLAPRHLNWDLIIAGSGDDRHVRSFIDRAAAIEHSRITFAGHVGPQDKAMLLRESDLFVLPSRSESFGIVVAEALASGLPAVVTRGAPWELLDSKGCGWWVEESRDALELALDKAMRCSVFERKAMGLRGRSWMEQEFGWQTIAQRMVALYREARRVNSIEVRA